MGGRRRATDAATPSSIEAANVGTENIWFAGYPAPFVYAAPDGKTKVEQTIWGDYVGVKGSTTGDWVEVRARGTDGFMKRVDLQRDRLLELNFVDVGQGDGCFIVTPDDDWIVVDAGPGDNMFRFLNWKYNIRGHPEWVVPLDAAVITHSDLDHYAGFAYLIGSGHFRFKTLYHNGIIERSEGERLGPREDFGDNEYLTELAPDLDRLGTMLARPNTQGSKYAGLLRDIIAERRADDITMLSVDDRFLGRFTDPKKLAIEVLGPVPRFADDDDEHENPMLPWFEDVGKTKNGHSVTLRLVYRNVRILLGGDLNSLSERYLVREHIGGDLEGLTGKARADALKRARTVFEADIAKACHHGGSDFTTDFVQAINPIGSIVSSGDDEAYAHPRPDALGAMGRYGRGTRPLIFSTELARSVKDVVKRPEDLQARLEALKVQKREANDELELAVVEKWIDEVMAKIERTVAVYGMINVRTDGNKIVVAQKLERPSRGSKWDVHRIEPVKGELRYVSKYG